MLFTLFSTHRPPFGFEEELQDHLTLRLAACYLEEGYPQAALDTLTPRPCSNQCLYLMSLAHRYKHESLQAFKLLQQCSLINESLYFKNHIYLEKGYHLFHLRYSKMHGLPSETVVWQENNPIPFYLARLNLTSIKQQPQRSPQSPLPCPILFLTTPSS